jgi:hypothetical protein
MGQALDWRRNIWTGHDLLSVPEHRGRIRREPWGPSQYVYTAEYWGDYSLRYPLCDYRHATLGAAKAALRRMHNEER